MYLIINDRFFGKCRSIKEANQFLESYSSYIKKNFDKTVDFVPITEKNFKHQYAEIKPHNSEANDKIQFINDLEELQSYVLTTEARKDEKMENMLNALNELGKHVKTEDKNIYLMCDDKILGKSENLEDINRFISAYLKSNTSEEEYQMLKNFMCGDKKIINKDNQGYTNLMYFKQNDGKTVNFTLLYPKECYQKFIYDMQQKNSIYQGKSFKKEKKVLAQLKTNKIKNINEIAVQKSEPNLTQKKALSDVALFEELRSKYSKFNKVRDLLQQVASKTVAFKEDNKEIQNYVNALLAKKSNIKWILDKYSRDNNQPEMQKQVKSCSRKDLDFMDNATFKNYTLCLIAEQLQDYGKAEEYKQYTTTLDSLKKNEIKLETLRDNIWKEVSNLEQQYKEFNPDFSIVELEQASIKESLKER